MEDYSSVTLDIISLLELLDSPENNYKLVGQVNSLIRRLEGMKASFPDIMEDDKEILLARLESAQVEKANKEY